MFTLQSLKRANKLQCNFHMLCIAVPNWLYVKGSPVEINAGLSTTCLSICKPTKEKSIAPGTSKVE